MFRRGATLFCVTGCSWCRFLAVKYVASFALPSVQDAFLIKAVEHSDIFVFNAAYNFWNIIYLIVIFLRTVDR